MVQYKGNEELVENFKKECKVIELCHEYGENYVGTEKYIIATDLSNVELNEKYSTIIEELKPYMLLNSKIGEVVSQYQKNEQKNKERYKKSYGLSIDSDLAETYPELTYTEIYDYTREETIDKTRKALDSLTELQRNVVELSLFEGMPYRKIADKLGKSYRTIEKACMSGKKNFIKFLNLNGELDEYIKKEKK